MCSGNTAASGWRPTACVVAALIEYARAQNELAPNYTVTLDLDGKVARTYRITAENALLFDNRFLMGDGILASGANRLNVRMEGRGTLYYNAYLKYFNIEESINGVANAIGVERKYYKITPSHAPEKRGGLPQTSERAPLADGAAPVSGDIIEAELALTSDNDYNYVVFEDMKPAGCEPLETHSGASYADGLCSNMELRDEKVAFFLDTLAQGTRRLTYRLRAETPCVFHALPTNAYAMYTPDIRALSHECQTTIADAPRPGQNRARHLPADRQRPADRRQRPAGTVGPSTSGPVP